MRKWRASTGVLLGLLVLGGGSKLDRLTPAERDHFDGLRVWMDKKQQKSFLKEKTEEARNQWLKDAGLWERWYKYDAAMRDLILAGEVAVGWPYDAVYMSWGKPHERKKLVGRSASRSELLLYRFEVMADGAVMVWAPGSKSTYKAVDKYTMRVFIDDDKVGELERKSGW